MVTAIPYEIPTHRVRLRGASKAIHHTTDREVVIAGAAGTGKTVGCLWYLHKLALEHPGMRALMVRKSLTSLTSSALVTYQQQILASSPSGYGVYPFGGSKFRPAEFRYPNGSVILVGGMDKASKVMSAEYDIIYANECTELTEDDWEALTTRLRHGVMPYQQIIGDCNPGAPSHWLKRRADDGKVTMLTSVHEENPGLYDAKAREWTERGSEYIATLEQLSGVRYQRLRLGQWAAAEGLVYDGWDRNVHVIDRQAIPRDWPRYWVLDFGYEHPFVWQAWAIDPQRRAYLYREIYMTGRLVEDHAETIMQVTRLDPYPVKIIADHDAEGRATFERKTGYRTIPAEKSVLDGINAVASRLRVQDDGLPRLFVLRDALVERDKSLANAGKPTCTIEEFESYEWDTSAQRRKGEQPRKQDDHGSDCTRYLCAHLDPWRKSATIRGIR